MSLVIVETLYDEPVTFDRLNEEEERLVPCLDVRQVTWRYSLLSVDCHRTICTYDAPDAEAVRTGHRMAHVPFHRIWAGELLEPETSQPPPSPALRIVMEATSPAVSQHEWDETKHQFLHALSEQGIEWLRTYRSLDRTSLIWELHAPDVHAFNVQTVMQPVVQTVQGVQQQVNIPCDRIWSAELLNPEIWAELVSTQSNLETV